MSRGKSKGAVVIDPAKAFQQACAFADCAQACETEQLEIWATEFARFSAAAANSAFACELFLKSMIALCGAAGKEEGVVSTHDLYQLYATLKDRDAEAAELIEGAVMRIVKLEEGYTFDKALRDSANSFNYWRYAYEHKRAKAGVMFLHVMRWVLRDECCMKLHGITWSSYIAQ